MARPQQRTAPVVKRAQVWLPPVVTAVAPMVMGPASLVLASGRASGAAASGAPPSAAASELGASGSPASSVLPLDPPPQPASPRSKIVAQDVRNMRRR